MHSNTFQMGTTKGVIVMTEYHLAASKRKFDENQIHNKVKVFFLRTGRPELGQNIIQWLSNIINNLIAFCFSTLPLSRIIFFLKLAPIMVAGYLSTYFDHRFPYLKEKEKVVFIYFLLTQRTQTCSYTSLSPNGSFTYRDQ